MASVNDEQAFAPILTALQTMQSNVDAAQKKQAHEYLEQFQKSVGTLLSVFLLHARAQVGIHIHIWPLCSGLWLMERGFGISTAEAARVM